MDLDKEIIRKAYLPFRKLAIYNCIMYTMSIVFLNIVIFILITISGAEGRYPWEMVIFVYLLLIIKAFRIPLMSLVEQKINCIEKVLVTINMIETDGIFGNYKNSNQEIKNCYPKDVHAERDKLICIDENGDKVKVRLIGSEKKIKKIRNLFLLNEKNVYITFGKITRIVFEFESVESQDSKKYNNVKMLNKMF